MSRLFGTNRNVIKAPSSRNGLTALTFSGWALLKSYGGVSGGGFIVKDPLGSYDVYLYCEPDGTLYAQTSAIGDWGSLNGITIATPGTAYVLHDTGTITADDPTNPATYIINSLSGSGIATLGFPANGDGFKVGQAGLALVNGGGQPGVGHGATINVTSLLNPEVAFAQTVGTMPLNTLFHFAVTWNLNGDGKVRIYFNGVEATYQGGQNPSLTPAGSTAGYSIGGDLSGDVIDGFESTVAIFNAALSAAQVLQLAQQPQSPLGVLDSNLIAFWPLIGTNPEPDLSGYGATGIIVPAVAPATSAAITPKGEATMATPDTPAGISSTTPKEEATMATPASPAEIS